MPNKKKILDSKSVFSDKMDIFAESFTQQNFTGSLLKHADFESCSFSSCDFSKSVFHSCRFIDCSFENCNLSLVKLTDSKFSNVTFTSSKLIGIDWTMSDRESLLLAEPLKFINSQLSDSNFYGLDLKDYTFKASNLQDVDFRVASLQKADLRESNFTRALFEHTHLEEADFSGAYNMNINVKANHLKGTIFSGVEAFSLLESMGIVLVD